MKLNSDPVNSRKQGVAASDANAIRQSLSVVQGKSSERIYSLTSIAEEIRIADEKLSKFGLTKSNRKGAGLRVCAGTVSHSYNGGYGGEGTYFEATHNGQTWRLTAIYRTYCPRGPHGNAKRFWLTVTEAHLAKAARSTARVIGLNVT